MHQRRGQLALACGAVVLLSSLLVVAVDLAILVVIPCVAGLLGCAIAIDLARAPDIDLAEHSLAPPSDKLQLVFDAETGLHNESYFDAALVAQVATARRVLRPLSVILLRVVDRRSNTNVEAGELAQAVIATLRESDTACVLSGNRLGLLLEDTAEDGAVWTAERLRRALVDGGTGRVVWAGVASYPNHGLTGDELSASVLHALRRAEDWHQDRIEVAT